jgi:hypothetical protein
MIAGVRDVFDGVVEESRLQELDSYLLCAMKYVTRAVRISRVEVNLEPRVSGRTVHKYQGATRLYADRWDLIVIHWYCSYSCWTHRTLPLLKISGFVFGPETLIIVRSRRLKPCMAAGLWVRLKPYPSTPDFSRGAGCGPTK